MTARTRPQRWREVKRRPVQGNSPNDRILRGPDCNRPKRVCADPFPATPRPSPPKIQKIPGTRFLRQAESIGPMGAQNQNQNHQNLGVGCRLPLVGPRAPVKERDGRSALCSSSATSSDRLFLDRVARQHCPSPLHRHAQTTMRPSPARSKPDISTLQRIGHFYFALTLSPTVAAGSREGSHIFLLSIRAARVRSCEEFQDAHERFRSCEEF
jgi:hypothetical protein